MLVIITIFSHKQTNFIELNNLCSLDYVIIFIL